jgi:hypothetical protein
MFEKNSQIQIKIFTVQILDLTIWAKALFSSQKILQNFSDSRHIKSLDTCMKH